MRKVIAISVFVLILPNLFGQSKPMVTLDHRFGVHAGMGVNFFTMEKDHHFKFALDLGLMYGFNENWLGGIDFGFYSRDRIRDRKYDAKSICWENYIGYKIWRKTYLNCGIGFNFATEYERINNHRHQLETEVKSGLIVGMTHFISNNFYLKYSGASIGYNRYSIGCGIAF